MSDDYDLKVLEAEARALGMARLTPEGREVVDGRPMAPPVGYKRSPSLMEQVRAMVRSEHLAREVARAGAETFEEANDFDVGDDYDPSSPYEEYFDPPAPAPVAEAPKTASAPQAGEPSGDPAPAS